MGKVDRANYVRRKAEAYEDSPQLRPFTSPSPGLR